MNDRYLFRGKRIDNGEWVEGLLTVMWGQYHIINQNDENTAYPIVSDTICQYTGLTDKNGKMIWENDITKLVLKDGEVRYFKVSFKKVIRKVICHPDFDDDVARVELNAICFEWNGYELFPCIDEDGVSDVSKMEVIGNIFDNPELLEAGKEAGDHGDQDFFMPAM